MTTNNETEILDADSVRKTAESRHLVDYHARILFDESVADHDRIHNLSQLWGRKAFEGFLPKPDSVGIFDILKTISRVNRGKLKTFFYWKAMGRNDIRQNPKRCFEDIIELADELGEIHEMIANIERCYWHRLEGYEAAAVDSVRGGTVSEVGSIQQVYNAADFVGMAYRKRLRCGNVSKWKGLTLFGQYHEFMHGKGFLFVPDYAKLRDLPMWIYFSHEISHCFIERFMSNPEFYSIYSDLVNIFLPFPILSVFHSTEDHLARDTMADILATLIAGEQYLKVLSELKYYPNYVVCQRKFVNTRKIQFPTLLRALICAWTMRIAWGFDQDLVGGSGQLQKENEVIEQTCDKVFREDVLVHYGIKSLRASNDESIKGWLEKKTPVGVIKDALDRFLCFDESIKREIQPRVIASLLEKRIIHRLKKFVKKDFYGVDGDKYYYDVSNLGTTPDEIFLNTYKVSSRCCTKGNDHITIEKAKADRRQALEIIRDNIQKSLLLNSEDPCDLIVCLSMIADKHGNAFADNFSHSVILSISMNEEFRRFRFHAK